MSRRSLALLLAVVLASQVHAEFFIVKTEYETTDTSCSTWKHRDWVGAQDVCQPFGDASNYGMTSATGKVYVKWTCTETHVEKEWYDDPFCTTSIGLASQYKRPLACSKAEPGQGSYGFYMETFDCKQSYPAAVWSRYTDSTCQTEDVTKPQEIVPLNFCRVGSWENSPHGENNGRKSTCASSGLETTLWQNSDCTGASETKPDHLIGTSCMESAYYGSHVKLHAFGCDADSTSESSTTRTSSEGLGATTDGSRAMTPMAFLLLSLLASAF